MTPKLSRFLLENTRGWSEGEGGEGATKNRSFNVILFNIIEYLKIEGRNYKKKQQQQNNNFFNDSLCSIEHFPRGLNSFPSNLKEKKSDKFYLPYMYVII